MFISRELVGASENGVQKFHSAFMHVDTGLVANPQFPCRLRSSRVISEENHFHVRMEQRPALERISLDDSRVAGESFAGGEEGDHGVAGSAALTDGIPGMAAGSPECCQRWPKRTSGFSKKCQETAQQARVVIKARVVKMRSLEAAS